ncbi:uncharacterized protein LOC132195785 [Neocloeon triangulifer]|uniref:uncharacterized protein LOC132195785 n=1 Tax=Neocloeon triangulifer TaxID=2078957 RepID=UPI00286F2CAE|nr:uncharacterized protein LOC132195785 [Neocloeon triangulifer]
MAVLASVWAPLFWIGKPLGVLPLSLDRERFLVSRLSFVYTFCGAACFVLGGFQKTAAVLRKVFVEPLDGQQILTFVSHSIVNAFALLNVYFSTKCARRLAAMFNELHALAKVTKRVPTLSTAAHVRTLVLLLQVAVFFNYMFFALYEKSSQGVSELVVSALRVLSLTSITCIGSHFCALCLVLRALVRAVNAELALLLAREAHSDGPTLLQHQLLRLRFVYAKIFDICVDMNNVFGIFVLLALTQYNIYIHVEVFTLLRLLVDVTANPLNTWLFRHTQALTWAVVNVAKILAYFVCCSLVLSEVSISSFFQI